jgi:hypothetical protein
MMAKTSTPRARAVRTTALTAAFIPGASPPLVKTAILLCSFFDIVDLCLMVFQDL